HVVAEVGAAQGEGDLVVAVGAAGVEVAEHGAGEPAALLGDDVEHAVAVPYPAGQVHRERHAGAGLRAGRAAEHLLLLRSEVGRDADLADDARAHAVHALGEIAFDLVGDVGGGHRADPGGVAALQVEAAAHDDVEPGGAGDRDQFGRGAPEAVGGDLQHRAPAAVGEPAHLLDRDPRVVQGDVVP